MAKIIYYDKNIEYKTFFKNIKASYYTQGTEGICAISNDGKVYKINNTREHYNKEIEEIITKDELNLPSFCFPDEIYVDKNTNFLIGYKTEYISKNFLPTSDISKYLEYNENTFDNIELAYKILLDDVLLLSKYGYALVELEENVLFDGQRFIYIDTCGYYKEQLGFEELLKHNIKEINLSIDYAFKRLFENEKITYLGVFPENITTIKTLLKNNRNSMKK